MLKLVSCHVVKDQEIGFMKFGMESGSVKVLAGIVTQSLQA